MAPGKKINQKLITMRAVVERTFGLLKGRWRILDKKIEQDHRSVSVSVSVYYSVRARLHYTEAVLR